MLAAVLISSGLDGCDKKNADTSATADALPLPLTTGPATVMVPAPAVAALPSAPPVRIVRVANPSDEYAYADRAYAMSSAVGQAPPDYEFDYQGVHPWAWRSSDRSVRLTEPVDGGYRYYYYQPGASEPYLVRDPQYAYGYSDGQLVAIYDGEGRLLPPEYIDQRADNAGRYLARAEALYEASLQNERRSVNAANWAERRAELDAARSQWQAQQSRQDAWRAYHAEHAVEEQTYWQAEHERRDRSARSFDEWSGRGFNGPPPPPAYYAGGDARGYQRDSGQGGTITPQNGGGSAVGLLGGLLGSIAGHRGDSRDGGQPSSPGYDHQDAARQSQQQQTPLDQARAQQAQADAARQAREKAQQQALTQARQQQFQADAAHQAQAQAQVRAQEDAIARARQQQAQADAARQAQIQAQRQAVTQARQQQAQADAARQSQARTDAATQAQQQRIQADAARAQQQTQADAAHKAQAQAQANAATRAQQKRVQADAARAQQRAQADATHKSQGDTREAAAKKTGEDKHPRDDASGKPPAQ
jgi:hypothetical protein